MTGILKLAATGAWLAVAACASTAQPRRDAAAPADPACTRAILEASALYADDAPATAKLAAVEHMIAVAHDHPANATCRSEIAEAASVVARGAHRMWTSAPSAGGFTFAEMLYRRALDAFPDAPTAARDEYSLADLRYAHAEAEPAGSARAADWDAVADAFAVVIARGGVDAGTRAESVYAAALACKHAYDDSEPPEPLAGSDDGSVGAWAPLPPRATRMIAAFRAYRATAAGQASNESVGMELIEARVDARYHHVAEAIPLYVDLVDHHRASDAAAYAASLLIDLYARTDRDLDAIAFATHLAADRAWLAGIPVLEATVDALVTRGVSPR